MGQWSSEQRRRAFRFVDHERPLQAYRLGRPPTGPVDSILKILPNVGSGSPNGDGGAWTPEAVARVSGFGAINDRICGMLCSNALYLHGLRNNVTTYMG